tara:strand:- start:342 stop:815 length:474 start_codon:yes stop_codon:yes gene_type:complete
MAKKRKLTDQQKTAIDNLFVNGFNRKKAYLDAYKCSDGSATMGFVQLMKKDYIKEYYLEQYENFKDLLQVGKYEIVDSLKKQIDLFDAMIDLSLKDELTEQEELKLSRLKDLVKGSDIMKARDMICRIMGVYEAEKVEVKNVTYSVGFDVDDATEIE